MIPKYRIKCTSFLHTATSYHAGPIPVFHYDAERFMLWLRYQTQKSQKNQTEKCSVGTSGNTCWLDLAH